MKLFNREERYTLFALYGRTNVNRFDDAGKFDALLHEISMVSFVKFNVENVENAVRNLKMHVKAFGLREVMYCSCFICSSSNLYVFIFVL